MDQSSKTLFGRPFESLKDLTSKIVRVPFQVQGFVAGDSIIVFPADNSGGFLSNLLQAIAFFEGKPTTDFSTADVNQTSLRTLQISYLSGIYKDVYLRSFQVATTGNFAMREMKIYNAVNAAGTLQAVYQQTFESLIQPDQPQPGTLIAADLRCNVEMRPGVAIGLEITQNEILSGFFEFTLGDRR